MKDELDFLEQLCDIQYMLVVFSYDASAGGIHFSLVHIIFTSELYLLIEQNWSRNTFSLLSCVILVQVYSTHVNTYSVNSEQHEGFSRSLFQSCHSKHDKCAPAVPAKTKTEQKWRNILSKCLAPLEQNPHYTAVGWPFTPCCPPNPLKRVSPTP